MSPPVDVEQKQTQDDNINDINIGAHLIQGGENVDAIVILQTGVTTYNGYTIMVNKEAKLTFTRENGKDKEAIKHKPSLDLYQVVGDSKNIYLINRRTYEGLTLVDYFSTKCTFLAEMLACTEPNSIFRDNREYKTPKEVYIDLKANNQKVGLTSVYISNGDYFEVGRINNSDYQMTIPRINLSDSGLGLPFASNMAGNTLYIFGRVSDKKYRVGTFNLLNGSSYIQEITANVPNDLSMSNTFVQTVSSEQIFFIQSETKISYTQIKRPSFHIKNSKSGKNEIYKITAKTAKEEWTTNLDIEFISKYTSPKIDPVTVGVKLYPGSTSAMPITDEAIVGQGMSYKVEWNSKIDQNDYKKKPTLTVFASGKYEDVNWGNGIDATKIKDVYGIGEGYFFASMDSKDYSGLVFTCIDTQPEGAPRINCRKVHRIKLDAKIENIERAFKAPGKFSYLILYTSKIGDKSNYFTTGFQSDKEGDIDNPSILMSNKPRIDSGIGYNSSSKTVISHSIYLEDDGKTYLKAEFMDLGTKQPQLKQKKRYLQPELLTYGFGELVGIATYTDGSGILLKSGKMVLEATMNNPSQDPTDLKYFEVRVYEEDTKSLKLCPSPNWIYQFSTQTKNFTYMFSHAHNNSGVMHKYEILEDRKIESITCDGFSAFINIMTKSADGKRQSYWIKRGNDPNNRLQSTLTEDIPIRLTTSFLLKQENLKIHKNDLYLSFGMLNGKITSYLNRVNNVPLVQIGSLDKLTEINWFQITGTDYNGLSTKYAAATKIDDMKLDGEIIIKEGTKPYDVTQTKTINLDKLFNSMGYFETIEFTPSSHSNEPTATVSPRLGPKTNPFTKWELDIDGFRKVGNYILRWKGLNFGYQLIDDNLTTLVEVNKSNSWAGDVSIGFYKDPKEGEWFPVVVGHQNRQRVVMVIYNDTKEKKWKHQQLIIPDFVNDSLIRFAQFDDSTFIMISGENYGIEANIKTLGLELTTDYKIILTKSEYQQNVKGTVIDLTAVATGKGKQNRLIISALLAGKQNLFFTSASLKGNGDPLAWDNITSKYEDPTAFCKVKKDIDRFNYISGIRMNCREQKSGTQLCVIVTLGYYSYMFSTNSDLSNIATLGRMNNVEGFKAIDSKLYGNQLVLTMERYESVKPVGKASIFNEKFIIVHYSLTTEGFQDVYPLSIVTSTKLNTDYLNSSSTQLEKGDGNNIYNLVVLAPPKKKQVAQLKVNGEKIQYFQGYQLSPLTLNINKMNAFSPIKDKFVVKGYSEEKFQLSLKNVFYNENDPANKKSKEGLSFWLWFLIVVVILVFAAGIVFFILNRSKGDEDDDTYLKDEEYGSQADNNPPQETFDASEDFGGGF